MSRHVTSRDGAPDAESRRGGKGGSGGFVTTTIFLTDCRPQRGLFAVNHGDKTIVHGVSANQVADQHCLGLLPDSGTVGASINGKGTG